MLRLRLNNNGDTIVEVMIAVALIGIAISGGYIAANRSTAAIRQAQDYQIANTIAQSQIENLNNSKISDISSSLLNSGFCYPMNSSSPVSSTGTNSSCNPYGNTATYPQGYNVSIVSTNSPTNPPTNGLYTFSLVITWPKYGAISTGGQNNVTMYYQTAGK